MVRGRSLTQVRRDGPAPSSPKASSPPSTPKCSEPGSRCCAEATPVTDTDRARLDKLFDAHPRLKAGWQATSRSSTASTPPTTMTAPSKPSDGRLCDLYETGELPEYHDTVAVHRMGRSDEILNWHHTGRPSNGRIEGIQQPAPSAAEAPTDSPTCPRNFEAHRGILVTSALFPGACGCHMQR